MRSIVRLGGGAPATTMRVVPDPGSGPSQSGAASSTALTTAGAAHSSVTPWSLDPAEDLGAVDLAERHLGHAHGRRGPRHAPAVGMEHRQRVEVDVTVRHADVPAEDGGVDPAVAVGELDPLRPGGGPRRVVDGGRGPLVGRPRLRLGARRGTARRRLSAPRTKRRLGPMPASASSSSGSTSSTDAPECSRMYSTSARASRKLTGTRIRPHPDTPKNEVSSRAELWETMATRSPGPMPRRSSPAAWARARSARSAKVSGAHGSAGWSGSSTRATRSA